MNRRSNLPSVALLGFGLLLAGCSQQANQAGSEQPAAQPSAQPAATSAPAAIDPATAATVSGTVKFTGQAPKPVRIDMSQDANCKGENMVQPISAANGNLENAFVYVKDGLGTRTFPAPAEKAVIDQKGCKYSPLMLGVMTGQTIEIRNDDPTTHNIHPTPKENREWNESQAPSAPPLEKTFAREEVMLQVKCNQHPWMKMFINVMKHPFYGVTDKDGKFTLKGLPPGEYTVAVVHERLGEQTQKITVGPSESKTTEFTYGAAKAAGL